MSDIKNVIVVGGTGNLGVPIVQALAASGAFTVSVLTRSGSASRAFPDGFRILDTDYSPSSLEEAFNSQDAVVSVVAGAALGEQKKLIDAAVAAGVKRFIPSEFGSNTDNKEAQELVPIFSRKVEIKNYLESQTSNGLTWTGIVTGPVFDRSLKLGVLGFDISARRATIYDSGDRPFTASTVAQVSSAVVGVLQNPDKTENKYVYVGSFTTTQNEILATLEAVTGDSWIVDKTSSTEKVEAGKEQVLRRRDSTAIRPLITAAMYHERSGSDFETEVGLSNEVLGLSKEDLATVIKQVISEL
ncbi:hypothetical protein EYR41_006445 [Orbilia oligospora]|uniref:NmrA-like domain-containing protein n=1 Tax=Orbilia oligospora TaxID=2813651 RepID=A0A7C8PSM8_ORBOL|nr:hypothetical protein TWF751_001987 [Orbilia oligospora]TGJ67309.1 hypothetical protein EYR41_006445 [Orbilia oligospora]